MFIHVIKSFIVFTSIIIIEYNYLCKSLVFLNLKKVIYTELGLGVSVVTSNDEQRCPILLPFWSRRSDLLFFAFCFLPESSLFTKDTPTGV